MAYNKHNFVSGSKLYARQLNYMDAQIAKNADHDHNDVYVKNNELDNAIKSALATAKASGEFDGDNGKDGKDGTSVTHSWNGTTLTVTSASGTSSANLKGAIGATGADGKDGTNGKDGKSVTVTNITTSPDDGGDNIVTFSDGNMLTVKNGSTGAAGKDGKDGNDGINGKDGTSVTHSWNGTTLTVTSASGSSSANLKGAIGATGADGKDGKSAYEYAKDGGYTGSEAEFTKKLSQDITDNYVTAYGAKGNGVTDDTFAFQNALAEQRRVFVPGGTYNLSAGLVIRDNCELELAQDTVLVFTQSTGNCITLEMISSLKGNHATIKVPYEFAGNVIYASTATVLTQDDRRDVEPFKQWDPQWKSGRYVTDINICKVDLCKTTNPDGSIKLESRNLHCLVAYEDNGNITCDKSKGTAMYFSADANCPQTFMWGVTCSGIRIAGAFEYGIRAQNFDNVNNPGDVGWNHEMRIEAIMDACETGVRLENCHCAFLDVSFQPRGALIYGRNGDKQEDYVPYAKHGIRLDSSNNVDLSGSRVWDWNATNTLYRPDNEYKFLTMYGDCRGAIVNAFQYYEEGTDIRKLIYTDTPSNLEQIIILQEPFDRWFKNRDGVPYFHDGVVEKKLATGDELEAVFGATAIIPKFTNQLPIATDEDGTVYNDKGYKSGVALGGNYPPTVEEPSSAYYISVTGFIPVKKGSVIRFKNLKWLQSDGFGERIVFYYKDKSGIPNGSWALFIPSTQLSNNDNIPKFVDTTDGFEMTLSSDEKFDNLGYIRMSFRTTEIGIDPIITVDEEIRYAQVGVLADEVKVKAENVVGLSSMVTPYSAGTGISLINNVVKNNAPLYSVTSATVKDVGDSTSGSYLATKWAVVNIDGIATPTDGMTVALRVPGAGTSGGILLSINNGTTYYPIVRNVSTLVTTEYDQGASIIIIFNSSQTASVYTTAGVPATVTGCWQICGGEQVNNTNTAEIEALIDEKLGVIENGTY